MNHWTIAARNAPLILRGMYEYNLASRFGPLRPREWLFPLTYRCDARCIMCNIWQSEKGGELGLDDWHTVLQDRLFHGIESVGLTGGEPTLRPDLPQLVQLLLAELPALRRMTITTNALATRRVVEQCRELLDQCTAKGVQFFVGISLDGIGPVHDEMRGIAGAFDRAAQTVEQLQRLQPSGLRMGINCTLTSRNLHDADNVERWSAQRGLPVNWIVASFADSYYGNTERESALAFTSEQRAQLAAFLKDRAAQKAPANLAAYFYADVAAMIERGKRRTTPCVFQKDAFMLDGRGDLQYCMYSRVLGNVCQRPAEEIYFAQENLTHRQEIISTQCQNCTITCFLELALAKDAFNYARFLMGGQP
jgi:MoaA/NifB/PqqE/SkfB family radical SAM enzyme